MGDSGGEFLLEDVLRDCGGVPAGLSSAFLECARDLSFNLHMSASLYGVCGIVLIGGCAFCYETSAEFLVLPTLLLLFG